MSDEPASYGIHATRVRVRSGSGTDPFAPGGWTDPPLPPPRRTEQVTRGEAGPGRFTCSPDPGEVGQPWSAAIALGTVSFGLTL